MKTIDIKLIFEKNFKCHTNIRTINEKTLEEFKDIPGNKERDTATQKGVMITIMTRKRRRTWNKRTSNKQYK